MADNDLEKLKFEDALARLEAIVSQLESGSLSLEDSMAKFEEGMRLNKICSDKLAEAESKIEMLVKRADGTLEWTDYNPKSNSAQTPPPRQP
ncbi:MAG TPA: exodeoxyribonuclease VII small subunit [Lentisphaeria bacterium]|nr:exodeoxyribonuclease VII small subunit [Lentisphaeria bacterium]